MPVRALGPAAIARRLGVGTAAVRALFDRGALRNVSLNKHRKALESEVIALTQFRRSTFDYRKRVAAIRKLRRPDIPGDIRRARKSAGIETWELSRLAGVHKRQVEAAEHARWWKHVSVSCLERIAEAMGMRLVWAVVPTEHDTAAGTDSIHNTRPNQSS